MLRASKAVNKSLFHSKFEKVLSDPIPIETNGSTQKPSQIANISNRNTAHPSNPMVEVKTTLFQPFIDYINWCSSSPDRTTLITNGEQDGSFLIISNGDDLEIHHDADLSIRLEHQVEICNAISLIATSKPPQRGNFFGTPDIFDTAPGYISVIDRNNMPALTVFDQATQYFDYQFDSLDRLWIISRKNDHSAYEVGLYNPRNGEPIATIETTFVEPPYLQLTDAPDKALVFERINGYVNSCSIIDLTEEPRFRIVTLPEFKRIGATNFSFNASEIVFCDESILSQKKLHRITSPFRGLKSMTLSLPKNQGVDTFCQIDSTRLLVSTCLSKKYLITTRSMQIEYELKFPGEDEFGYREMYLCGEHLVFIGNRKERTAILSASVQDILHGVPK